LIDDSKESDAGDEESDEDVQDGENQEPNVSRMPGGFERFEFVDPVGNDVAQVLDALSQQGGLGMAFVPDRVLGGHHVARCLEELNRQRREEWGSFVGQLFGVFDKVFRENPMRESSSDQVKDGQGSFLTMGSFSFDRPGKGFEFEVSGDGLGGEVAQNSERESEDVEEAEAGLEEGLVDGSFGSIGLGGAEMARGTVVLLEG